MKEGTRWKKRRHFIRMWYPGIPEKKMFKPGNDHLCQMLKSIWVRWVRELTIGFCKEFQDPEPQQQQRQKHLLHCCKWEDRVCSLGISDLGFILRKGHLTWYLYLSMKYRKCCLGFRRTGSGGGLRMRLCK